MGAPSPFFIIVSMPTDAWFCTEMEYFIVLSPWRAGISGVSHSFLSLSPCTSSPCTPSLCTSLPSEWPTFISFLTTNFRDKAEHQVFLFSMWLSRHPALQSTRCYALGVLVSWMVSITWVSRSVLLYPVRKDFQIMNSAAKTAWLNCTEKS